MGYLKIGLLTIGILVIFIAGRMSVVDRGYQTSETSSDINNEEMTPYQNAGNQADPTDLIQQLDYLGLFSPKPVPSKDYNSAHYERTIVKKTQDITTEEIQTYNQHHVIAFNPIVDVLCHETHTPEGASSPESECVSILERPRHPYFELGKDELIELARTDAVAALVLATNTEQPDKRIYWSLRASALSSKSGPLVILANRNEYSYGLVRHFAVVENDHRGVVVRLALEKMISLLNDPRGNVPFWEEKLQTFSREDFAANLIESEKLAAAMLQNMILIQAEVGRSDILEKAKGQ